MPEIKLEDKITIVVPCKNEENYIGHLLDHLKLQGLGNTKIIVADASTDGTRDVIRQHGKNLNIEVIQGGAVSVAKNNGARLATTPYILFIDSDVRFFSTTTIADCVREIEQHNLDLIGLYIKCYDGSVKAQLAFMIFNAVNIIMKHWTPFAVGAFMLTRRDKFQELGGFSNKYTTSEDFFLSKMYDVKKFRLMPHYFGQDSRRFQQMGYFGMAWYLIKNFLNRNNAKHWNSLDHNRYWK
jgi:glycosyltransferase involved in cell wall biosynthesis